MPASAAAAAAAAAVSAADAPDDDDDGNACEDAKRQRAPVAPASRHSYFDQSNAAARYRAYQYATRCVLAGRDHDRANEFYTCPTGRRMVNVPVIRASTVHFPSNQARRDSFVREPGPRDRIEDGLFYGRMGTLTQRTLEEAYAAMEGAHAGIAMMTRTAAACAAVLAFLRRPSDAVLAPRDVSAPVKAFFHGILRRMGPRVTYLEHGDMPLGAQHQQQPDNAVASSASASALEAQLARDDVKVLYLESPSVEWNGMRLYDLERIDAMAQRHGVRLVVDNTWGFGALPAPLQRAPHAVVVCDGGAALLGGHNDVSLGLIACPEPDTYRRVRFEARKYGAAEPPVDAYLAQRGLRTMHVRASAAAETTARIAQWLEHAAQAAAPSSGRAAVATVADDNDAENGGDARDAAVRACVARVIYPGLPSHPDHAYYERLRAEWAATVSKGVIGGGGGGTAFLLQLRPEYSSVAAVNRFIAALRLFHCGWSVGAHACVLMPLRIDTRCRRRGGGGGGGGGTILRLSFGLESADDVRSDLRAAFHAAVAGEQASE